MAWSYMRCAIAGILAVFFANLQVAVGKYGFELLERDCGRLFFKNPVGPRIVNGNISLFGAHPWMAFVHSATHFLCGGTLINHWFVLTAAHCIENDVNIMVRLGEYNRDQEVDCLNNLCMEPYEQYEVSLAFRHKFFNTEDHANDIGMLRLDRRVTYTASIQPICVFVGSKLKPLVDRLTWFNATGWGAQKANSVGARILQELKLNRRTFENCERRFGKQLFSSQICSGNDDSNLCNGDSGGPQGREMSYGGKRVYVQLGIASFTNNECEKVSILTDVLSHGNWIKRVVQRYGIPEDEDQAGPAQWEPLVKIPTFYKPI